MSILTALVGAVVEAWQELRIHRTRVLLSLIGVAVAVCSLTTVVALGAVLQQVSTEQAERSSGRPATLYVGAYTTDGSEIDPERMQQAWTDVVERYDITYATRVVSATVPVDSPSGVLTVGTQAVDQPYGEIHRVRISEGEWFSADAASMLAPQVIVNEVFWDRLGRPDLLTHPTLSLGGPKGTTAVIVGVYPSATWETQPAMFMLADQLARYQEVAEQTRPAQDPNAGIPPQYELWVPEGDWQSLADAVKRDISAVLGGGVEVDVNRQDAAQFGDDAFLVARLVVGGIAVLVLLLGALGLVNIALVTVRQRIREIGIRRSFGATAGRVFFAVMMESVVATVIAGALGVVAAILLVQSPFARDAIGQGVISDFPPFPVDAAVLGLVAATAVGAVAGLLPALVAVRVKVIDAIRY
ncbi:ABC transporter permease [Cnuibacter physcomitrellae]|uniref:ABC transporter permease n=1 Tax=Cnuibacter physcomitrellae TaxID=1619308 RepID=UPI002175E4D6|nr:ABC transporter permease [Cnuibacter physcomitrellae]MCS5498102.1 ABC transporter permease [Cnuibacter physcomitrellae]